MMEKFAARNAEMLRLHREEHLSYARIGQSFGVSNRRAEQICSQLERIEMQKRLREKRSSP